MGVRYCRTICGRMVAHRAAVSFFRYLAAGDDTISSIVTFLMVFLIQNAQNRDSSALQLKLDELIRVTDARNKLMGIEQLSEPEIEDVRDDVKRKEKPR